MADTQRTRSALQTLFADNVTGQISAQDLRDFLVTAMQEEFVNANDFWCEPQPDNITTDQTTRGYHLYSQLAPTDMSLSFGKVYCLTSTNQWSTANASLAVNNYYLGVAADSYASGATTVQMLIRGIVYDSDTLTDRLTGCIGRAIYLLSTAAGSISITDDAAESRYVGVVLPAGVGSVQTKGKWYFNPTWAVTGA